MSFGRDGLQRAQGRSGLRGRGGLVEEHQLVRVLCGKCLRLRLGGSVANLQQLGAGHILRDERAGVHFHEVGVFDLGLGVRHFDVARVRLRRVRQLDDLPNKRASRGQQVNRQLAAFGQVRVERGRDDKIPFRVEVTTHRAEPQRTGHRVQAARLRLPDGNMDLGHYCSSLLDSIVSGATSGRSSSGSDGLG